MSDATFEKVMEAIAEHVADVTPGAVVMCVVSKVQARSVSDEGKVLTHTYRLYDKDSGLIESIGVARTLLMDLENSYAASTYRG